MIKNTQLPELLAPAGSPEAFEAAIAAGADAVYFGTTLFNARMNAHNFTRENVGKYIEKAHENGVKCHVTLNTAMLDRQLPDALRLAEFLYKSGADALIVADFGLVSEIHRYFPDFPIHASTQCSAHNLDGVRFLKDLGAERVVVSRELSKENLAYICENAPVEIEAFVHGALCVSQSGQCLFSSLVGGRSGNRGECAQPCRLPYNGGYPLSLKDNCLARHVTELCDMGVSSLKIEGRMKGSDYVRSVVSVYRQLLDEKRNATESELREMAKVFSRSGFTDGYFTKKLGDSMRGIRTDADKEAKSDVILQNSTKSDRKLPKIEIPARENALPENYRAPTLKNVPVTAKSTSARFLDPKKIPDDVAKYAEIVYLPLEKFDPKKANGVILPPVIPDDEMAAVRSALRNAKKAGAKHLLVANVGQIALAKESGMILHGDYRFNICSGACADVFYRQKIFADVLLSPELTLPQIRDIGGARSVIVYGSVPLMTLENPVLKSGESFMTLRDRRGVLFPVCKEGGRDVVYNSVPFYMGDRKQDLEKARITAKHFIFTSEGPQLTRCTFENYAKNLGTRKEFRRFPV